MKHQATLIITIWALVFLGKAVSANNIQLEQVRLTDSTHINFTVSWNHSWNLKGIKPPYNHDAAWVFLKYTTDGRQWQHLAIDSTNSKHSVQKPDTGNLQIHAAQDQKGLLLTSTLKGSGTIPATNLKIKLAKPFNPEKFAIRAFGTEMVFIPEDSFYLGDNASNFRLKTAQSNKPYFITTEAMIPTGRQAGNLTADSQYRPAGDIPKAYPNGYSGGYVMKYEISQEQYVDFLNTLTLRQQSARVDRDPGQSKGTFAFQGANNARNGIVISQPAKNNWPAKFACNANADDSYNDTADGQARACNLLKWSDVTAFLDWAGLRPMTELTYEKICRGPEKPVKNAFSWGTPKVTDANTIVNDGTLHETAVDDLPPNNGLASHGYRGPKGPLRNGFGGSDTSNRLSIGAAYYGALEMSGNLWELVVVTNQVGLDFQGQNGDGKLTEKGFADEPNWPGKQGKGAGFKGGAWNSGIIPGFRDLAVSDRFYIFNNPDSRRGTNGGRGFRSIKN